MKWSSFVPSTAETPAGPHLASVLDRWRRQLYSAAHRGPGGPLRVRGPLMGGRVRRLLDLGGVPIRFLRSQRRSTLALCAAGAAVLAVGAVSPAGAVLLGSGSQSSSAEPGRLLRAVCLPDGDVAVSWRSAAGVVSYAGRPGTMPRLTRTVVPGRHPSVIVRVSSTPAPSGDARDGLALSCPPATAPRSVYWNAIGIGLSPAAARRLTLSMGGPVPKGAGQFSLATAPSALPSVAFVSAVGSTRDAVGVSRAKP